MKIVSAIRLLQKIEESYGAGLELITETGEKVGDLVVEGEGGSRPRILRVKPSRKKEVGEVKMTVRVDGLEGLSEELRGIRGEIEGRMDGIEDRLDTLERGFE